MVYWSMMTSGEFTPGSYMDPSYRPSQTDDHQRYIRYLEGRLQEYEKEQARLRTLVQRLIDQEDE